MATSPLGGFADLASYRRLVDAQKAANANGLETLINNYIGGAQQGNVMVNLPEILQQQNQDRRNKALSDQIALQLQGIQLNEAQNPSLALDRALRSKLALEATTLGTGVIQSPDVLGTLGATPIATPGALTPEQMGLLGIREENAAVGGAPVEIPTAQAGAPITPIPTVTGAPSGFSQDLNRAIEESVMLSRAKGANTADIAAERNAAFLQGLQAKKILGEEAIASKEKIEADKLAGKNQPVDPVALQGALNIYKQTGQIPTFGFGNSPLRTAFFAALGGGDANAVSEGQTNKAVRSGITNAYRTQQNLYQAEKTALSTLDKQLGLAKEYSDKVDRSGSPVINKYLLYLKGNIAGDADTKALENIVQTASYEFAKILSGSAASIAGTTISSAEDAKTLLNGALNTGQFNKIIELMKKESEFRLNSRKESVDQLKEELGNIGSEAAPKTSSPSPAIVPGTKVIQGGKTYQFDGKNYIEVK